MTHDKMSQVRVNRTLECLSVEEMAPQNERKMGNAILKGIRTKFLNWQSRYIKPYIHDNLGL